MSIALTPSSRILFIGDSVAQITGIGSFSPFFPVGQYIRSLFASGPAVPTLGVPFLNPVYKTPTFGFFNGTAGREAFTIGQTAPTFAAFAAANFSGPFTHAIVQLGINDAANVHAATRTLPQVLSSQGIIMDGINSIFGVPYSAMMAIGPWQRPSDLSVEVPQIVTQWKATQATRPFTFVDWSGISNANSVDLTHPNQAGAAQLAVPVNAAIVRA